MRIVFLDQSTKLNTVVDLDKHARGGMVTSLFKVTDHLVTCGHDVTVISDIKSTGVTRTGTKWLHETLGRYDVLVTNRGVGDGYPQIDARHRVLWTHDLPHMGMIIEPRTICAYDRTVFMSKYAEKVWRSFFKHIGKSTLIPNGVDKKEFYPRMKIPDYMIFASNPNRGLERLPFLHACIQQKVGRPLQMRAYSNREVLHPGEHGEFEDIYKEVEESEVELCDPVPQQAFANEIGKASLMLLPTDYPEICSNIILQSLVSGTPVVTTGNLGSAGEWIKDGKNGKLTSWYPHDYMVYQVDFIRDAVAALNNKRMQKAAAATRILSWPEVGTAWNKMLHRL